MLYNGSLTPMVTAPLSAVVGSTRYEDVERHAFHSEELEVLPSEWRHMALELDLDAGMES